MMSCLQGAPGGGKTAVAVALGLDHLRNGGVVAANFALNEGWSDVLARRSMWSWFDDEYRFQRSNALWQRFYQVKSLKAVFSLSDKLPDLCEGQHAYDGSYKEGGGLLILDEAQLILNSRKWDKNFNWIEFGTQHRKLGWNVLMIAHSIEMIDSQIRPLFEYELRFRNMQKVRLPIIGLPLSPIPMFNIVTRYAGLGSGTNVIAKRELIPLPLWAARLYNSKELFKPQDWASDDYPEPLLCGAPPTFYKPAPLHRKRLSSISPTCLWSEYEKLSQ